MIFELLVDSIRNLLRHKLRSFLTALGIICGIASVMSMVATGEGAKRAILSQIQELGIKNIILNAKKPPQEQSVKQEKQSRILRYGLTFRDQNQIRETLPFIEHALPVRDVKKWIWFRSRRLEASVRGVTPDYFTVLKLVPLLGRTLDMRDGIDRRRVAVIRTRLLEEAKYVGDPLKLDLKIGSEYYRVVGVLPDFAFQSPNKVVLGIDDRTFEVYVPFDTVVDRFGLTNHQSRSGSSEASRVELHQIVCAVDSEDNVLTAAKNIQSVMERFHPQKDWEMTVPLELLESRQQTQKVFALVMPIIAGISLLVGGIGILNIMLASITERTREIGIRRAIGATRFDITLQFLIETVCLSTVGGLAGVLVGVVGVRILDSFTDWQPVITPWAVTVSLIISCATGVVFGLYPARRAAVMDPIRALRHD